MLWGTGSRAHIAPTLGGRNIRGWICHLQQQPQADEAPLITSIAFSIHVAKDVCHGLMRQFEVASRLSYSGGQTLSQANVGDLDQLASLSEMADETKSQRAQTATAGG